MAVVMIIGVGKDYIDQSETTLSLVSTSRKIQQYDRKAVAHSPQVVIPSESLRLLYPVVMFPRRICFSCMCIHIFHSTAWGTGC